MCPVKLVSTQSVASWWVGWLLKQGIVNYHHHHHHHHYYHHHNHHHHHYHHYHYCCHKYYQPDRCTGQPAAKVDQVRVTLANIIIILTIIIVCITMFNIRVILALPCSILGSTC